MLVALPHPNPPATVREAAGFTVAVGIRGWARRFALGAAFLSAVGLGSVWAVSNMRFYEAVSAADPHNLNPHSAEVQAWARETPSER